MSSTSTGAGFTTSLGTGPSIYDLVVALAKDQTSNHRWLKEDRRQQMEMLTAILNRLDKLANRIDARSDTKPLDLSGGPR